MEAITDRNQTTLFDLGKMKKPESNISLRFNKAVGLIDLIPNYTKENTLLLMEILIFWAQKAFTEKKEYYFVKNDNQWYTIPFSVIEEMMNYKKSNNRSKIVEMLEELMNAKVHYNFMGIDNTIDLAYRKGSAVIISQVDYLDKNGDKANKKYSDSIDFAFSPLFNDLVREPKIFANIDLMTSKKLSSISARQLYQHCKYKMQIKKRSDGISEFSFDELKKLSGKQDLNVEFKTYSRDILKRDRERINQKTDIELEYTKKRGQNKIVFTFKQKEGQQETLFDSVEANSIHVEPAKSNKPLTLEQQQVNDLFIKYKIDTKIREEFFKEYSCRRIRDNIKYVEEVFKIKQKTPTFSYIIKAIREDYAKSEETIKLEDKSNSIEELWQMIYSFKGVEKDVAFHYKHLYIGTTIYCYREIFQAKEEDFKDYYKFKEVKKNFNSLADFQLVIKEHMKNEFSFIETRLNYLQEKYNLSLEDICSIKNQTKKDLFKMMGMSEEEYLELRDELCK